MRKLSFLSLIMLAYLISCQMQKIMVNVYTPSKLVFPPTIRYLLVTSRFVPATGPYEDIQWGAYESVDSLKWKLSESLVDTLAKRISDGDQYTVKVRHLLHILRHNGANLPDPAAWEGLQSLAKKEMVQAILIIEGFGLTKTPVVVTEKNGSFQAQNSIEVTIAIRVYEPGNQRMIDDSVYTFSTAFIGTGKTEQEAANQLPDDQIASQKACADAAEAYSVLINPGEVPAKRYFVKDRDSMMMLAENSIREGKWGKAESKWNWLAYNSPDTATRAKASYNMALICERYGKTNQAIGFARRSQRLSPDNHTLKYINVLNKKILDFQAQIDQKKIIKRW